MIGVAEEVPETPDLKKKEFLPGSSGSSTDSDSSSGSGSVSSKRKTEARPGLLQARPDSSLVPSELNQGSRSKHSQVPE